MINTDVQSAFLVPLIVVDIADIKAHDIGPRVLKFLEAPVTVVNVDDGQEENQSGTPQKRKRET